MKSNHLCFYPSIYTFFYLPSFIFNIAGGGSTFLREEDVRLSRLLFQKTATSLHEILASIILPDYRGGQEGEKDRAPPVSHSIVKEIGEYALDPFVDNSDLFHHLARLWRLCHPDGKFPDVPHKSHDFPGLLNLLGRTPASIYKTFPDHFDEELSLTIHLLTIRCGGGVKRSFI